MTGIVKFPAYDGRGYFEIRKFHSVEIETSWKLLTDRATIELPRNVKDFDKQKVRDVFRRGMPVEIWLGYDGNNKLEFKGYITEVSADIPIQLKCEDEMWKIKQLSVNYSAKNTTLKDCLQTILPGYEIDALEGVQLGAVRFSKTTAGKVLAKFQSDWNLYTYMKGNEVISGKYYADDSDVAPHVFFLERNCASNELQYKRPEDIRLRIRAISTFKNGQRIEVTVGDDDGVERQLSYYNIIVEAELEKLAKIDYEKSKAGGFDGSFTAFGIPSVKHGEKVLLISQLYEDRNGEYYIESITKTFGRSEGYRQQIKLGGKVA